MPNMVFTINHNYHISQLLHVTILNDTFQNCHIHQYYILFNKCHMPHATQIQALRCHLCIGVKAKSAAANIANCWVMATTRRKMWKRKRRRRVSSSISRCKCVNSAVSRSGWEIIPASEVQISFMTFSISL